MKLPYDTHHDTGFTIHDTIVRLGQCSCTSELGVWEIVLIHFITCYNFYFDKDKHTLLTTEYIVRNTDSHHSDTVLHHTSAKYFAVWHQTLKLY